MFSFENLDDVTRSFMLEAIDDAELSVNIYFSKRFNDAGDEQWLKLLKQAAKEHNEHWLAFQLEEKQLMKDFEGSRTPSGNYTIKHVPHNASATLADGQFNRFYILGLCKRARTQGDTHLVVYRAKQTVDPRPESQSLLGTHFSIEDIESQLKDKNASFKSQLVKPNSGISVKLP